ncbi:MAG TPA: tRNA uracil 4-sulfurtransferase ThiI [Methanoregulaceae archaeon]|nr:tRNA uracil 4-sulfurtransferase ThiI [Methanoregulaceae archaeon]
MNRNEEGTTQWIVRYSEIFLKSDPVRREWEQVLMANIRNVLPGVATKSSRGRIWLSGDVKPDILNKVFGIVSFSETHPCSLGDLEPSLLRFCEKSGLSNAGSFALRIKRVGAHDFKSQEMAVRLGDLVRTHYPEIKTDLSNPEKEIFIEIREDRCYIYDHVFPGAGGLPLGVEGTLVALVSGGIDSPVAAWMMMKRGCRIIPVFVALAEFLDETNLMRARNVIESLKPWQPGIDLIVIEDDYLSRAKKILVREDEIKYTCLLCKRRMYRLAVEFARMHGAKGIVTGESLGQVASQTLDNLIVLDDAAELPVYRPLIGFDKEDTIRIARKLGTFQISISKAKGCGAVPKGPSTKADLGLITGLEEIIGRETNDKGDNRDRPGDNRRTDPFKIK